MDLTFDMDISKEAMDILLGGGPTKGPMTLTALQPILVQARTHRKKRINKKWLKRYGYKTVYVPVEMEIDVTNFDLDGAAATFVGNLLNRR